MDASGDWISLWDAAEMAGVSPSSLRARKVNGQWEVKKSVLRDLPLRSNQIRVPTDIRLPDLKPNLAPLRAAIAPFMKRAKKQAKPEAPPDFHARQAVVENVIGRIIGPPPGEIFDRIKDAIRHLPCRVDHRGYHEATKVLLLGTIDEIKEEMLCKKA
jgi:hypothetical protein